MHRFQKPFGRTFILLLYPLVTFCFFQNVPYWFAMKNTLPRNDSLSSPFCGINHVCSLLDVVLLEIIFNHFSSIFQCSVEAELRKLLLPASQTFFYYNEWCLNPSAALSGPFQSVNQQVIHFLWIIWKQTCVRTSWTGMFKTCSCTDSMLRVMDAISHKQSL